MEARTPERAAVGAGWVAFAGVLFLVVGSFNVIDGIVAVVEDDHFVADELFFGDLMMWGWILIGIGALQILTAGLIFIRSWAGQFLGIFLASLNLVAQLFFISVYPIWSVLIMVIDAMIIYGLTVYGDQFE
jgi:hypothetical protein